MTKKTYDFALSFAGKDRCYAQKLAELLDAGGCSVFYDKKELAHLLGKNLYDRLSSIYKDEAQYCVMFLSQHYGQDRWTKHERESAQARAFEESQEYILPVRLDDTEIPRILPTVGYLDLREISIEQVYEILMEKLQGTPSQAIETDTPSPLDSERYSGEFALFRPDDGQLYFLPFQNARWDSTDISLELLPESSEEEALLRTWRASINSMFNSKPIFAFALGDDAAWVSPKEVSQTMAGSQVVWKVVLKEGSPPQNEDFFGNTTFANISPDHIAEMRARRLLLDEKLEAVTSSLNQPNLMNQATLELFIRGMGSSRQVLQSPLPDLYQSFGPTGGRFEKFARLISVLYLKLSNTVQTVLQLDLELRNPKQLQVKFRGRRPQQAINIRPSIIEVNGICPLNHEPSH